MNANRNVYIYTYIFYIWLYTFTYSYMFIYTYGCNVYVVRGRYFLIASALYLSSHSRDLHSLDLRCLIRGSIYHQRCLFNGHFRTFIENFAHDRTDSRMIERIFAQITQWSSAARASATEFSSQNSTARLAVRMAGVRRRTAGCHDLRWADRWSMEWAIDWLIDGMWLIFDRWSILGGISNCDWKFI